MNCSDRTSELGFEDFKRDLSRSTLREVGGFLVESAYMDHTDQKFLVEPPLHSWTLGQSISGYFMNRGKAFVFLFSESIVY